MPKLRELLYLQLIASPDNGYLLLVPRKKALQYGNVFRLDDKQACATAMLRGLMEEEYFVSSPTMEESLEATEIRFLCEPMDEDDIESDEMVVMAGQVQPWNILRILMNRGKT